MTLSTEPWHAPPDGIAGEPNVRRPTGPMRKIALLMGQELGYCRGVLRGVHQYIVQTARPWVFHNAAPQGEILGPLREWNPHGIIAHLFDRRFANRVVSLGIPLVNTTNTLPDLDVPLVEVNHERVGQLAAEHLLARGFKHFGYFGSASTVFSRQRERGFRDALAAAGYGVSSCYAEYWPQVPPRASWKQVDERIRQWLLELPKPAAILASNDLPARDLAEMSRMLGVRVPDDVALLGVDNDEVQCLLASPPLSSVVNPAVRIGFEAARLLDRLMQGRKPPKTPLLIPPSHVITRQSTDIVAVDDPVVSAALAYIRQRMASPIRMGTMVRELCVGRRDLEKRFRRVLGRTPLQEIHRVRIEAAKSLLATTDHAVSIVARLCGFSSPQRLAMTFGELVGMSPRVYRRQTRP